jgi:hypothetical protein
MAPKALLTLAFTLASASAPALAHPAVVAAGAASGARALQIHLPLGRQANGAPAGAFKLNAATPHKTLPSPAKTPDFNPLKRRRMAMPALDPETQLAF